MDGSRKRRHQQTAYAAWLAVWRAARFAQHYLAAPVPETARLASMAVTQYRERFTRTGK